MRQSAVEKLTLVIANCRFYGEPQVDFNGFDTFESKPLSGKEYIFGLPSTNKESVVVHFI